MSEELSQAADSFSTSEEVINVGSLGSPSSKPSFSFKKLGIFLGVFLLLVAIPAGVFLVKQRQEIRKKAILCGRVGAPCEEDYPEACTVNGQPGTRMCHKRNSTCTCVGEGPCCSWSPDSYCDPCVPSGGGGAPTSAPQPQCPGEGASCQGLTGTHCNTESCCEHTCQNGIWGPGTYCGSACLAHPDCLGRCGVTPGVSPTPRGTPPSGCPYDVTPYVKQTGTLPAGYATCNNGGHACLKLELPQEYENCLYLAEVYTDGPQNCGNTEAHQRSSNWIGNGGQVCFPALPWDGDCKAQIDIRAAAGGAPAGNIITYKIDCGGGPPPPSPTPTPAPAATCNWIKAYNLSWQELTSSQLSSLKPGDHVYFAVMGELSGSGQLDKARFRVNGTANSSWCTGSGVSLVSGWCETTNKRAGTQHFYVEYIIPSGVTNFEVQAEVHHTTLGWR